jgi:plasmid maintenance system antidote protein VapI
MNAGHSTGQLAHVPMKNGSGKETWLRMQLAYDLAAARKDEGKIKVRRQHVPQELHMS